jgi:hypothetical protein
LEEGLGEFEKEQFAMMIVGGVSSAAEDELARVVAAMEMVFEEIWCIFREGRWTIQCARWVNTYIARNNSRASGTRPGRA